MSHNRLLICILAISLLCSCSNETTQTNETPALNTETSLESVEENIDPAIMHDLPEDLTFSGADFKMLSPDEYGGICFVEEQTGEVLNDAQYRMEIDTEERLDVAITEVPCDFWEMQAYVTKLCMSGDSTYSSIVMMDRFALACAYENCFISLRNVEHVDLSKLYWGGKLSQELSVGDNLFFGIGAFNLRSYNNTACVFYNQTLGESLGVTSPVEAVYNGTWTLDAFKFYENVATADLNGDGVMDEQDRYTYGSGGTRSLGAQFWVACGLSLISKDAAGYPVFTGAENEKLNNVMNYTYELLFHSDNRLELERTSGDKYSSMPYFAAGKELLNVGTFMSVTRELRDMDDTYTILPMPKYDEMQEQYYSRTFDPMYTMIPITAVDPAMSGAVIEYLSYTAYNNLVPAYIETSLKEKYSRDNDSVKFLQLAFDGRRSDIVEVLLFDIFGDQSIYDNVMRKSSFGWSSYLASKRKAIEYGLNKYIKLAENED